MDEVKAEIQKIVLEALSLGWKTEQLWVARFWNITEAGNRPGLAAVMRPGDRITKVTECFIAIEKPYGEVLRFYHPDLWIRKGDCHEQQGPDNP